MRLLPNCQYHQDTVSNVLQYRRRSGPRTPLWKLQHTRLHDRNDVGIGARSFLLIYEWPADTERLAILNLSPNIVRWKLHSIFSRIWTNQSEIFVSNGIFFGLYTLAGYRLISIEKKWRKNLFFWFLRTYWKEIIGATLSSYSVSRFVWMLFRILSRMSMLIIGINTLPIDSVFDFWWFFTKNEQDNMDMNNSIISNLIEQIFETKASVRSASSTSAADLRSANNWPCRNTLSYLSFGSSLDESDLDSSSFLWLLLLHLDDWPSTNFSRCFSGSLFSSLFDKHRMVVYLNYNNIAASTHIHITDDIEQIRTIKPSNQ